MRKFFIYTIAIFFGFHGILLGQYEGNAPFCAERGGLFINELSNGPSEGMRRQEYIELVAVGAASNPAAPVNLTGWLIDDNNFPAAAQGTARGHIIFGDCYNAVPPGSILVIYNAEDRNAALPPDDPNDTNPKDGVYIIPDISSCLKQCNSNPTPPFLDRNPQVPGSSLFCPCQDADAFTNVWVLGMDNDNDLIQVRDRCETIVHAIYWDALQAIKVEDNIANSPVAFKFDDNQREKVIRFMNLTDNNWNNPLNFDNPNVNVNSQTPGRANGAANENFIQSLRNGANVCQGIIYDCDDADAGDLIVPADAGASLPIQIEEGEDLGAFQANYDANDEFVPDALGFSFEYAFLLTQNDAPTYTILDFNLTGDFDFSMLAPNVYRIWGFSYIQTNGTISILEFLSNPAITSIQAIGSYNTCGFDGDLTNFNRVNESVEIIIGQRPCFTTTVTSNNTSCPNVADGNITIEVKDAINPLQIEWNVAAWNGQASLSDVSQGEYVVSITDAGGCRFADTITITAANVLPSLVMETAANVCQNECLPIQLSFSGIAPYRLEYELSGINTPLNLISNQSDTTILFCPTDLGIIAPTISSLRFQTIQDAHCKDTLTLDTIIRVLPTASSILTMTLCRGEQVEVNGQFFDETNPSGNVMFSTASGCDSIVQVQLTFLQPVEMQLNETLCAGTSLTVNGNIYNQSNPIGTERIVNGARNGCDSIIQVNLTFLPPATGNLVLTICEGASVAFNGTIYDVNNITGIERLIGQAAAGCDSLVNVSVELLPPTLKTFGKRLCIGDSIVINGTTYNQGKPNGIERLVGTSGCDTLLEVNLIFEPVVNASLTTNLTSESICDGTPVELKFLFDQVGTFNITYTEGNILKTLTNIQNGYTISVLPDTSTIYSIKSVVSTDWQCIEIGEEASLTVSRLEASILRLTDYNGFEISCKDAQDGAVEVRFEGGIEPINVQWNNNSRLERITELAEGTYHVIVTDAVGCVVTDSITLISGSSLIYKSLVVPPTCFGDEDGSIQIDSILGGLPPYRVTFNDATNNIPKNSVSYRNLSPGKYPIQISDQNGCKIDTIIEVMTPQEVGVELGEDIVLRLGDTLALNPATSGAINTVKWIPADYLSQTDSVRTTVAPLQTMVYELTIIDSSGCLASDRITIFVVESSSIYVPNAFSPNGDGINDFFTVFSDSKAKNIQKLSIYDRWGDLIFRSNGLILNKVDSGWDGKTATGDSVPNGSYVYEVVVEFINNKVEILTGIVQVLK